MSKQSSPDKRGLTAFRAACQHTIWEGQCTPQPQPVISASTPTRTPSLCW